MTTANDQLTALYTLATEWEGGFWECPWWVKEIRLLHNRFVYATAWFIENDGSRSLTPANILSQHALDLITANAERWLGAGGIFVFADWGVYTFAESVEAKKHYYTLIDALKYAKEQG